MIKFGTGGWRAVIGDDFTKANIQLLAKALCRKMKDENAADKGIVIGYDRRFLAKEAMQWAGQVFAAEGVTAYLVNKSAPTPLVMFYVMKHEMPYGMMITASHNPAIYNGIKVFTAGGRDASAQQTDEIEEYIGRIENEKVEAMEYDRALEAGLIQEIYPLNEYLDNIIDNIDMQAIRSSRLKIALDPMYGVSVKPLSRPSFSPPDVRWTPSMSATIPCSAGSFPRLRRQPCVLCRISSWTANATSESLRTGTRTGWESSTIRANSFTPTISWSCCTITL